MKQNKYRIEFKIGVPGYGPFVELFAFSREQARILAQAERIKCGFDYEVEHIWDVIS